jgi:hypothetical protein
MAKPLIHVPSSFDPWRIQALAHDLADHPLLQIGSLVELGKRQQARKLVRTHSADATAATSFADAPNLHPNAKSAEETLADVARARAWMSLLNVQADPVYRGFIDEVLDSVRPDVDRNDPGMCYRAGWIFVSSPNAITPFHIDHEHNFILQIRGKKRLFTWDHRDRDVVSERGQELFHDEHSRELVIWREHLRQKAIVFDLEPGMGGYMPSTTPHMVENGDDVSITISFTYYTDATRRRELLYRTNTRLRRFGVIPTPVGESPARDALKNAVMGRVSDARAFVRRALGRGVRNTSSTYAPA